MCGGKKAQYSFIIDSFNWKKSQSIDFEQLKKYIKTSSDLFDDREIENCSHIISDKFVIIMHTKFVSSDRPTELVHKIYKKYSCDIHFIMIDDEDCNEYLFLQGTDYKKHIKSLRINND